MHSSDANLTTLTAIHTTIAMASRNTALSPLTDLLGGDLLPFRVPANRQAFFFPQIKVKTLSPNGSNPWNRMLSKGGANASIRGNKVSKVRVGDELSQVIGRYPPLPEMWERVGLDTDRKPSSKFKLLAWVLVASFYGQNLAPRVKTFETLEACEAAERKIDRNHFPKVTTMCLPDAQNLEDSINKALRSADETIIN